MLIRTKNYKFIIVPYETIRLLCLDSSIPDEQLINNYKEFLGKGRVFICAGEISPDQCLSTHCASSTEVDGELFAVIPPCTMDELFILRRMRAIQTVGGDWEGFYRQGEQAQWQWNKLCERCKPK